jgi:hypothetical protein
VEPTQRWFGHRKRTHSCSDCSLFRAPECVDIFLQNCSPLTLSERREAALLGALEGRFVDEIENRGLLPSSRQSDFSNIEEELASASADNYGTSKWECAREIAASSLAGVAVFACLIDRRTKPLGADRGLTARDVKALKWVASNTDIEPIVFLRAAILVRHATLSLFNFVKFIDLFKHLVELGLNPFFCEKDLSSITGEIVSTFHWNLENDFLDESFIKEWFGLLASFGLNIQSVCVDRYSDDDRHESFLKTVAPAARGATS